jgi:hypothetical protein
MLINPLKQIIRIYFVFILCIFCLVGCIVVPTPEHGLLGGRGKIEESDIVFLECTKTSREEVLLRFGEPDLILNQDRTLVYHWVVSHGYWFVGAHYTGGGGPIPKDYLFILDFDEHGKLSRYEITGSLLTSAPTRINKWTPTGFEKPREVIIIDPMPTSSRPAMFSKPISFRIGEFSHLAGRHQEKNFIGQKIATWGVVVADIRTRRPLVEMLRLAIIDQLEKTGNRLVDRDEDVFITGDISEFDASTSLSLSSWSAIGSVNVTMKYSFSSSPQEVLIRHYRSRQESKTILGPSKDDFEQVMRTCLEDIQKQVATDAEFIRMLDVNASTIPNKQ